MNNAAAEQPLSQANEALPEANNNVDPSNGQTATSDVAEGYGHDRSRPLRRHPDLFDWDEAAALLGCSKTTLKRIRRAGRIGFTPIGSGSRPRIWFHRKDIEEYLAAQHGRRPQATQDDDGGES